ncbi:DUF3857 domain-containing protein [Catalinimonas alkaloidigena]|nr:DUF3857 domain-containing protein [Catalinimonas alkaloidigena]
MAWAEDQLTSGTAYLLDDKQHHVAQQTSYFHHAYRITHPSGVQEASEIEVSYDPTFQQLIFHRVRIRRNGQEIDQLDPARFRVMQREEGKESHLYDGTLTALLLLEDVRAGDEIEYAYSIRGRNPLYGSHFYLRFYLRHYAPFGQIYARIVSPRALTTEHFNTTHKPALKQSNGTWEYVWDAQRIKALEVDDHVPYWYDPFDQVQVTDFASWQVLNDLLLPHYTLAKPTGSLAAFVERLKATYPTPEQRLEAALDFVQNEVRYTGLESGIGAYKPRPATEVFTQRFGDCKDKSLLLCSMLQAMDIEAHPALVNSQMRQEIKTWLPLPNAFDHCVVQVRFRDQAYWYDPTISGQQGAYDTVYFPNYRTALVLSDNTQGLTDIPESTNVRTEVIEEFYLPPVDAKSTENRAGLHITTVYHGYEADYQRSNFTSTPLKSIEKDYLNYYANLFDSITVASPLAYVEDTVHNTLTTAEHYEFFHVWQTPDSLHPEQLAFDFYPRQLTEKIPEFYSKVRTMPAGLRYPLHYQHRVKVYFPENWSFYASNREMTGPGFYFKEEGRMLEDKVALFEYEFRTTQASIAAEEVAEFARQRDELVNNLGYTFTYNTEAVGAASRYNGWAIGLALVVVVLSGWCMLRVYRYDPAPGISYTTEALPIGGWLILPAIGLVIGPFKALLTFFSNGYFNALSWQSFTDSTLTTYNPALAAFWALEMSLNIFFFCAVLLLLVLFFQRRTSLPKLISLYYLSSLGFILLDYAATAAFGASVDMTNQILTAVLSAAIWVPYFNFSERVQETFLKRSTPRAYHTLVETPTSAR